LENILIGNYLNFLFEKVVFDFELGVSVVILDHGEVKLLEATTL
jgi:hypothetical protein